jgi:hypothetical protein
MSWIEKQYRVGFWLDFALARVETTGALVEKLVLRESLEETFRFAMSFAVSTT